MALPRLWGAAVLLLGVPRLLLPSGARAASSHSLHFLYTAFSEPGQGLPQFIAVGYVGDQLFVQYDSDTRKYQPRVPWIVKVDQFDPQYWELYAQTTKGNELQFRGNVVTAGKYHNQSRGLHTLQLMYGCELRSDGSKGGAFQFGYDGRDFLSFDKETLTWTAVDVRAQLTKWKWEAEPNFARKIKAYLEETCIEWLQRYLGYGKELLLLRREPPKVKVTRQKSTTEDVETLVCQAHGFYPKEIKVTWTKDGQSREHETFRRRVVPNADGTYYIWICIDIDPKERDLYRCRVDHAGLSQPLVLAWEEPVGNVGLIVAGVVGAVLAVLIISFCIFIFIKKRRTNNSQKQPSPCSESLGDSVKTLLDKCCEKEPGPVLL